MTEEYTFRLAPNPGPQTALLECPIFEILFGGSRGGGKTAGLLLDWEKHADKYGKNANGLCVRRELTQLVDMIRESHRFYDQLGWSWRESEKTWVTKKGARLRFDHLENDEDADRYQGWSLCVAVGTPIRMADGSVKPIEAIRPTEALQTLEGPRRVLGAIEPYVARCVRVRVSALRAQGSSHQLEKVVLGEQVHPITHPVLTSAGLIYSHKAGKRRTAAQLLTEKPYPHKEVAGYPDYARQDIAAWHALAAKGDQTSYTSESASHLDKMLRLGRSVPVVLHVPERRSKQPRVSQSGSPGAISNRYPLQLRQSCLTLYQVLAQAYALICHDLERLVSPFLCFLDHIGPDRFFDALLSCGRGDLRTVPNYQDHYFGGYDLCGAPVHGPSGNDRSYIPSLADVEQRIHVSQQGGSGTIPIHNHSQLWSWVHPYSGEERRLVEPVCIGLMDLVGFEDALVTDLCVEGANHYINAQTGLINKNTWLGIEEIGLFPHAQPIMKLKACLRSPTPEIKVSFRATGNPGGPGMHWVKKRYIDPAPHGYEIITDSNGLQRIFIPSRIKDNPYLDEGYEARVRSAAPNEAIARAWIQGDWNISEGAYFPEFEFNKHVIPHRQIPAYWQPRTMAYDWGGAVSPSAALWSVMVPEATEWIIRGQYIFLPKNAIIIYREKYWAKGDDYKGLNLPIEQEAEHIHVIERDEPEPSRIRRFADPAIWQRLAGGSDYRTRFAKCDIYYDRADNTQVDAQHKHIMGWNLVRHYLVGENGSPMLYIMSNCIDLIRTLPALEMDRIRPDQVRGEDHLPDCFAQDTIVNTEGGPIKIKDLVGTVGKVHSINGLEEYHSCQLYKEDAEVVKLTFDNGKEVVCTPDHKFLTIGNQWVEARELKGKRILCSKSLIRQSSATRSKNSTGLNGAQRNAEINSVLCIDIKPAGKTDVYCLTVPSNATFAIEGGILTHNCLRYILASRPYVSPSLNDVPIYHAEAEGQGNIIKCWVPRLDEEPASRIRFGGRRI